MNSRQQKKVDELVRRRRKLTGIMDRICFDNDPKNGPIAIRIAAMIECDKKKVRA